MSETVSYAAAMPEIVLAAGAMVLLMIGAFSGAEGSSSHSATLWPARAKVIAQARPTKPEPTIATFAICYSPRDSPFREPPTRRQHSPCGRADKSPKPIFGEG